jgi:hypothetical protein
MYGGNQRLRREPRADSKSPNIEASTLPEFARKLELGAVNRRINRLAPLTIF